MGRKDKLPSSEDVTKQLIGTRMRYARQKKGISLTEMAKRLGYTKGYLSGIENSSGGRYPSEALAKSYEKELELKQGELTDIDPDYFVNLRHIPPYHRNPFFIGREGLLERLHRILAPEGTATLTQPVALSGLGGIGKTQTAVEYAYRFRQSYQAILWLQADSQETLVSSCVDLAHELALPEQDEADQSLVVAAIKRWLKQHMRWLLVLDNVEDLSMVEEFHPPGHHGCVLLTTHAQITEPIAIVHELKPLPEEEGVLLLLRRAGYLALDASPEQIASADYADAKELWELVEG